MLRRTFLRTGALAGLALYSEPWKLVKPTHHDWIEDRGDFVIVRVPDGRLFSNETIAKPAIFLLGVGAHVANCEVLGYANVHLKPYSSVKYTTFDGSKMAVEDDRPVVRMRGNETTEFSYNYLRGNTRCQAFTIEA